MAKSYSSVNVVESINRNKLIYDWDAVSIINYFFTYFIALCFIGICTLPAIIKPANISHVASWYIIFCVMLDSWILLNLVLMRKLAHANGINFVKNKECAKIAVKEFYSKINLIEEDQFMLCYEKPLGLFTGWYGKVITILFSEETVYINIVALGRGDSISPFHGISSYIKSKKIAKRILQLQE